MLRRKSVHWWITVDNVLAGMNSVFSDAEVVERIVNLVKPVALKDKL